LVRCVGGVIVRKTEHMSIEADRIFDVLEQIQRPVRTVINIVLAILIGLLAARFFWFLFAPAAAGASSVTSDLPRPLLETRSTLVADRTVLFKKNYFETTESTVAIAEDAPETKLNLSLVGTTAPSIAHIQLPTNETKRFVPGDVVINGVELIEIESDRVLLSRDGNTEVLLQNPDRTGGIVPFREGEENEVSQVVRPAVLSASGTRDQFFAAVAPRPMNRSDGEYLQLFPKSSQADFESLNFQDGDILLEVGGIAGTNFEQLAEIVTRDDSIVAIVERAGKPVQINIRFSK